jgi:hypothetical protein
VQARERQRRLSGYAPRGEHPHRLGMIGGVPDERRLAYSGVSGQYKAGSRIGSQPGDDLINLMAFRVAPLKYGIPRPHSRSLMNGQARRSLVTNCGQLAPLTRGNLAERRG